MATALMTAPTEISWVDRLRAEGPDGQAAVADLHALLLKAARFEVGRRAAELSHLRGGEEGDLAQQAADDALIAVLGKLDQFRGESRFTTWAYKFALLEAAVRLRRRAWQGRGGPPEAGARGPFFTAGPTPHQDAEQSELFEVLQEAIREILTPHQREVLVALALNGVPI